MLLPVLLLAFAIGSAAVVAYGTRADLARFGEQGVQAIMLCRRMQWPMVSLSVVLCIVVIGMVIAGRRRAWWLIGLAPVLMLFVHRFGTGEQNNFAVIENPPLVAADQASFLRPDDWVVGVVFDEQAYAYPYAALYATPVVIQAQRDRRMMLLWSPFANVARAYAIDREVRGRDLDVVSMPANALLVYNQRLGQFINGITGHTSNGGTPTGLRASIVTTKMRWTQWRALHADTKVLAPSGRASRGAPAEPVLPAYPMPELSRITTVTPTTQATTRSTTRSMSRAGGSSAAPPATSVASATSASTLAPTARVVMVPTSQPVAIPAERVTGEPLNLVADRRPVLLFRDPATNQLRGFDRRIDEDLSPRFTACNDKKRKQLGVAMIDTDTNTGWSAAGVAIDGPEKKRRGQKLKPVEVDEDVYWGVMHFWFPSLRLIDDTPTHAH